MFIYKSVAFKIISLSNCRKYCSALYLVGTKATDTCAIVYPNVDVEHSLNNIDDIYKNVKRRKRDVNLEKFKDLADFFLTLDKMKKTLSERRILIENTITELQSKNKSESVHKYKIHSQIIGEDLKNLKSALWSIEENVMLQALSLPNVLHPRTCDSESIIETYKENDNKINSDNHLNIGSKLDLISFTSPYNYYLKSDAALFELQAKFFFSGCLRSKGYVQFSNPDFVKSVVVEGCGTDHMNSDEVFILHHNENSPVKDNRRLHLTGGSSVYAYAAYFLRNILPWNQLPLRYYCFGRQYKPVPENSQFGLYEVSQASAIEIFAAVANDDTLLNKELDKIISDVTDIYRQIDYPFKVCYVQADKLYNWESLRVSFQMYSPFHKKYIEVGNVSVSDDYISKRLQITYKGRTSNCYLKIISGTVLSVPKLLGFALEFNTNTKLDVPTVFEGVF